MISFPSQSSHQLQKQAWGTMKIFRKKKFWREELLVRRIMKRLKIILSISLPSEHNLLRSAILFWSIQNTSLENRTEKSILLTKCIRPIHPDISIKKDTNKDSAPAKRKNSYQKNLC